MKRCKVAMESDCGKSICCLECEELETCSHSCELETNEGCEHAYEEELAMQEFNNNTLLIMQEISLIHKHKKELEEQEKIVRAALEAAMNTYGIKSFDNELLKVTYVAPTIRTTIDSKSLKKDMPEIYEKYSKISEVKESVRITVK